MTIPRLTPPRNGHGFGRLKRVPDTRDWLAKTLLPQLKPKGAAQRRSHEWTVGPVLDQGTLPQCVAYTGLELLYAGPVLNRKNLPTHDELYKRCQELDEFPDTPPEDGSSSRGLMKALQELGFIKNYAFANDSATIIPWLAYISPVPIGSIWTFQMESPIQFRRKSWLMIDKGPIAPSDVAGGHEWLLTKVHLDRVCPDGTKGALGMRQTWGESFGDGGDALLPITLLDTLLLADADGVMPTEIHKPVARAA